MRRGFYNDSISSTLILDDLSLSQFEKIFPESLISKIENQTQKHLSEVLEHLRQLKKKYKKFEIRLETERNSEETVYLSRDSNLYLDADIDKGYTMPEDVIIIWNRKKTFDQVLENAYNVLPERKFKVFGRILK